MSMIESAVEQTILENLRNRYQADGYSFYEHPGREIVPAFLGDYKPDAIAVGPKGRLVIEVKQGRPHESSAETGVVAAQLLGHPDWRFVVVYADDEKSAEALAKVPSKYQIEATLKEVEDLSEQGYARAALVLGWAALEAAHRATEARDVARRERAKPPRQVLEALERGGYIGHEMAEPLWNSVGLRNAVVHGDLDAEVRRDDVAGLTFAVRQVLRELPDAPPAGT